jgi:hypothetical protein
MSLCQLGLRVFGLVCGEIRMRCVNGCVAARYPCRETVRQGAPAWRGPGTVTERRWRRGDHASHGEAEPQRVFSVALLLCPGLFATSRSPREGDRGALSPEGPGAGATRRAPGADRPPGRTRSWPEPGPPPRARREECGARMPCMPALSSSMLALSRFRRFSSFEVTVRRSDAGGFRERRTVPIFRPVRSSPLFRQSTR